MNAVLAMYLAMKQLVNISLSLKKATSFPLQLTGNEKAVTGFLNDGKESLTLAYGNQAKSAFCNLNGNTYYFDARGHMVTNGEYSPNGKDVYRFYQMVSC